MVRRDCGDDWVCGTRVVAVATEYNKDTIIDIFGRIVCIAGITMVFLTRQINNNSTMYPSTNTSFVEGFVQNVDNVWKCGIT